MENDSGDVRHMWSELVRKEDALKWGGHAAGIGSQYDSAGRRVNATSTFGGYWIQEQKGRVDRVRQALDESGPMARDMIVQRFAGIDLSAVADILIQAGKDTALLYGGSVVAGGFVGGVAGTFLGGVGAVPGAAAGAAFGGQTAGWILAVLGLKSLVQDVARSMGDALYYYEAGFRKAWGPYGTTSSLLAPRVLSATHSLRLATWPWVTPSWLRQSSLHWSPA